jgi:hypothetical protein
MHENPLRRICAAHHDHHAVLGARKSACGAIIAKAPEEIFPQIVPVTAELKGRDWNAVFQIWNEILIEMVGIAGSGR